MTHPGTPSDDAHLQQARALLLQKQPAEAVAVIRRRLAYAPGTAVDHALLGVALAEVGDVEHAISALDQSAKLNPADAAVAYNLGLLYRKAGRDPEAATCFEHALSLRPDYDAARRALEAVRQAGEAVTQMPVAGPQPFGIPPAPVVPGVSRAGSGAAPAVPPPAAGGPDAPIQCPHCGMETRPFASCEWCSRTLLAPPPPVDPGERGAAAVASVILEHSEADELEQGNLLQRMSKAAWMLLISPVRAANGGLDTFFNSPGAALAVIAGFLLVLGIDAGVMLLQSHPTRAGVEEISRGWMAVFTAGYGLIWVVFTAFVIALFNAMTGGSDSFLGDFGSLALSFAFLRLVIVSVLLPFSIPAALSSGMGVIILGYVIGLWTWLIQVILVMGATDLEWRAAAVLLFFSGFLLRTGLFALFARMLHSM